MSLAKVGLVLIVSSILFGALAFGLAVSSDKAVAEVIAKGDGVLLFLGAHPVLHQIHEVNRLIRVLHYAMVACGVLGLAALMVGLIIALLTVLFGLGNRSSGRQGTQQDLRNADTTPTGCEGAENELAIDGIAPVWKFAIAITLLGLFPLLMLLAWAFER